MATIASDTFTEGSDTALSSHTPGTGTGWTLEAAQFTVIAATDDVRHAANSLQRAREGTTIGDDNMDVTADCKVVASATRRAGVCARMNTSDFTNQYEYYMQGTAGGTTVDFFLFKNVAGARTQLGTSNQTLAHSTYATIKLSIGTATQTGYFNGSSIISTTEADSTLSGNNYAGIIEHGNSDAPVRVDNYLSESVSGASSTTHLLWGGRLSGRLVYRGLVN